MDFDWKKFYREEREKQKTLIKKIVYNHWNLQNEDVEVNNIFKNNGVLSFPHTYLSSSILPLCRTIKALYKSGKEKVLALGVLHFSGKKAEEKEFSLDAFEHIAMIYANVNCLPHLQIKKVYIPINREELFTKTGLVIPKLQQKAKDLSKLIDNKTRIVMTGDLAHYGYGYKTVAPRKDQKGQKGYEILIDERVNECLELVYRRKDYRKFIERSRAILNDQIIPAIVASMILGRNLEYKIFSRKLSDYSAVLQSRKPTVVASIFYGVYPI